MMTKIELINFQSHKLSVINLKPGINGIIAPSNVGKSSIQRIVKWVLYNNLPGEPYYIRRGADSAIGRVHFSTGVVIERERGRKKKDNYYRLYQDGNLVQEFTGFGKNVPTEIQEAHGMMPANPKMNLNFWDQLDRPFLITDKPTDRAEAMGNLEELQSVDTSLIETNSEILSDTKSRNVVAARVEQLEAEILQIESELELDESRKKVVLSVIELVDIVEDKWHGLNRLANDLATNQQSINENNLKLERSAFSNDIDIDSVEKNISSIKLLRGIESQLDELVQSKAALPKFKQEYIDTLSEGLDIVSSQAAMLHRIDRLIKEKSEFDGRKGSVREPIDTSQLDIEGVEGMIKEVRFLMSEIDRLTQNAKNIAKQEELQADAQQRESKALTDLLEALHEVEICPTCGQATDNVDEHAAQHAIQS